MSSRHQVAAHRDLGIAAMSRPPRPRGEGVITGRVWAGIFYVGAIMAAGTLVVLGASLPAELAAALRRAAAAHGEHEKRIGKHDTVGWPDWYAEYMVAEQAGKPLPT